MNGPRPSTRDDAPDRRTVLLLEDDEELAGMLAAELRRSHPRLRVCTAATLASALEEVERGWLHGAVIDRSLPDGDGLDLVRRLRARGREMPFVLLTADATAAS